MAVHAIASQVTRWTPRARHSLVLTVALGLALVVASVNAAPISAHASTTRTTRAASGNPPSVVPAKSPGMYCGMPNAPKVTFVRSATRAEVKADLAKFHGKAQAAAIGDHFILGSPNDVVQTNMCWGGYNSTSQYWGGDIANQYGAPSTAQAPAAQPHE